MEFIKIGENAKRHPDSTRRRNLPVLSAAVRNIIIFVAVLSIPLAAAQSLGLSAGETSSWILALYGIPAALSLILTLRYRQPLLFTGNLFVIIFINGLGNQIAFPELMGAAILAGAAVLLISFLGLTGWMAKWIPVPIMFGLLAGAVLPFISDIFTFLGVSPLTVGVTVLIYFISRKYLRKRIPAIFPALAAGLALAALTGGFERMSGPVAWVPPAVSSPVFSAPAILTATPVLVVLIVLQANLPSLRFLQSQNYQPSERIVDAVSGIGTLLGSFLGPIGVSLSLPATSLVAGSGAGVRRFRHRAVYLVSAAGLLIGLFASITASLAGRIPMGVLLTLAGLSVIDIFTDALKQMSRGPLLLGPVIAFAVSLSEISFLGFGNYFWSLVLGTGVTLLLEREGFKQLQEGDDKEPEEIDPN